MASPSELTLDYNPNPNPNPKQFGDQPEPTQKLEDFLARLEEERLKIEVFKRELPLCMQLLNNAMETYKRQLETYQTSNQGLQEFIPISNMTINGSEKSLTVHSEKANWMVSAQLWSPASNPSTKLGLDTKQRNGGAFLPFSKEKSKGPELALVSSKEKEIEEEKKCSEIVSNGVSKSKTHEDQGNGSGSNGNEGQSTQRKARRCWSPDLHRRFVNALQMLGGSQVATPKQIRELMKVDGLTNDEVKSHLQKYRLHTRRPIHAPHPSSTAPPQLVVLGGIWVPPEYATSAAAASGGPTIYGSHPATAVHYPVPHHDFYASPPPHHHLHHAPAAVPYKARPVLSPDSELRSGGGRSESIEDGEDGEIEEDEDEQGEEMEEVNAEDKALVPLEGNGNGSDVALKF